MTVEQVAGAPTEDFPHSETITTEELARRTNTGQTGWAKRRVAGTGPRFIKIGRQVRYRWGDVVEWLNANARASTSEGREAA